MLCGLAEMIQAAGFDGVAFDPFSFKQDGLATPEVDFGRRQVGDALVVSKVVVVSDEGADLVLEIARQVVVLEQDAVLEDLMLALDLALGLGVQWRPADMIHATVSQPVGQVTGKVG
jgi:hypothetical protein